MIDELAYFLAGIFAGTISGLIPGIHANTVALSAALLEVENTWLLAVFIVSMSITHAIADNIPSTFLGAADSENSVNSLPAHRMLMRGEGLGAIMLSAHGFLTGGIASIMLFLPFYIFAQKYSSTMPQIIPPLILIAIAVMIKSEKQKTAALLICVLSGVLGIISLESKMPEPVLALVIGFFGLPNALEGMHVAKIPVQKNVYFSFEPKFALIGAVASGFLAFLPAIGPAQASSIIRSIIGKFSEKEYVILNGAINSGNLIFSILMLYGLEKTRTGMAVAVAKVTQIGMNEMLVLTLCAAATLGISCFISIKISEIALKRIHNTDYSKICIGTGIFQAIVVLFFSGISGLVACASACSVALAGRAFGVARTNCMAFLLVPTLLYYLGN